MEFQEASSLAKAQADTGFLDTKRVIPACSPLMWLAAQTASGDDEQKEENESGRSRNEKSGNKCTEKVVNKGTTGAIESNISDTEIRDSLADAVSKDNRLSSHSANHGLSQCMSDLVTTVSPSTPEDLVRRLYQCSDVSLIFWYVRCYS